MNQNRRKFIKTSAAGSAALFLSSLDTFSQHTNHLFAMNKNYELKIMATNWGFQEDWMSFVPKQKKKDMME